MKGLKALLTITLLKGFVPMAFASDIETSCNDSTMEAFSLRKCDLTKENTRIVTEFGERIIKSDCIGSAKLLYNHVKKILYAVEPDRNRKLQLAAAPHSPGTLIPHFSSLN